MKRFFAAGLTLALTLMFVATSCKREKVPSGEGPDIEPDTPIAVQGVSIVPAESQSIKIGEKVKLTAVITPENATNCACSWESDKPGVASVSDEGLVCGESEGTASISVRTEDGGFTAAVDVTVCNDDPVTPDPEHPQVTDILLSVEEIPGAGVIYKKRARDSQDIGVGATHKYKITVVPSDAPQSVRIANQATGYGGAKFSIAGNILTVTVPSTRRPPDNASTSDRFSYVTLEADGGFTKRIFFYTQKYDPYQVKEGDYIVRYSSNKVGVEDGGYRGNGRYDTMEASVSKGMVVSGSSTSGRHSIIMYFGTGHIRTPYWSDYGPSSPIMVNDEAIHGIAVPLNLNKMYRSDNPEGEIWSDSKSYGATSDNRDLPSWAKLYAYILSFTGLNIHKANYAFFNTLALVAVNAGNGSSYEVRPAQFFVNDITRQPAIDMKVDSDKNKDFSDAMYWKLSEFQGKLPSVRDSDASVVAPYVSPWLFPSIADYCCIFAGEPFTNEEFAGTTSLQAEAWDRLELLKKRTGISDWNLSWWACQEYNKDSAAQFTISDTGNYVDLSWNGSCSKDTKNFVYPILYF